MPVSIRSAASPVLPPPPATPPAQQPDPAVSHLRHLENLLSSADLAALINLQIPPGAEDSARLKARDVLDQHFSWGQAWRDFTDTLLQGGRQAKQRGDAARSAVLGLRQLLIIRDLSQVLRLCTMEALADMSQVIAEREMDEGTLLDIPQLARNLDRQITPWTPLHDTLDACLQRAFRGVQCSPHALRDTALSMLLHGGHQHADALAALLQLVESSLTSGLREVQAAHTLNGHLGQMQEEADYQSGRETLGALDQRHANLVARSLRAEMAALQAPQDAAAQQALQEAQDRLQTFQAIRATPRDALSARHNALAGNTNRMRASAASPPAGPTASEDVLGLMQRIDRQINLFDLAAAEPAAHVAPRPYDCPPDTYATFAGGCVSKASVDAMGDWLAPNSASAVNLPLEKELLLSIKKHAPAVWGYLHDATGAAATDARARLEALQVVHSHEELTDVKVRGGIGAAWREVQDAQYSLVQVFKDAENNSRSRGLFLPASASHVQVVATTDKGQVAPPALNTPDARKELATLLKLIAVRTHPGQTPWMRSYAQAAPPAQALALGALLTPDEGTANQTRVEQARSLLQNVNQALQTGWHATGNDPYAFIQKYLQDVHGAPTDILEQNVRFHGEAKVRDGYFFHSGRMPFYFDYKMPLRWAIVRLPEERCDEALVVAQARSSHQRDVQDGVAATVRTCNVEWPAAVTANGPLAALLSRKESTAVALLREKWDASFNARQADAGYQAALAVQIDAFLSTKLDNLRLQRDSSTLQDLPAALRAHYASQADAVRQGTANPLLLALPSTSDTADGLILLPGPVANHYLAVPINQALPARLLTFTTKAFGKGLHLTNADIAWLRPFFGPDRLDNGTLNSHSSWGFANGGMTGGDGPDATWETTRSPTELTPVPTTNPVTALASAHQARQLQTGQAILRSQDELDDEALAGELEAAGEVMMEVSMVVGLGELLLPELLAAGGVEMAVVNGGVRLLNYGAMSMQFAAGWEHMRADQDHPLVAKHDADNLLLSTLANVLMSASEFKPGASASERLAAATGEAENARKALQAPIASGHLQGAYRVGEDLYIPLKEGKLHRVQWDAQAAGFRRVAAPGAPAAGTSSPLYRLEQGAFAEHAEVPAARAGQEHPPARRRGGPNPAAAETNPATYQLPSTITRTVITDADGEMNYVRYSAKHADGTPSDSRRLVVSAHGSFLSSESDAAVGTSPVHIPADVTVSMSTPHDTYLMDGGIDTFVNPPAGYTPFLTLKGTPSGAAEITEVNFVPQQEHGLWKAGKDYNPASDANTLGRKDGLQNYRHHHYEDDSPQEIAESLLRSRENAAAGRGAQADVLVVNEDAGIDSPVKGVVADTGVQKVLDMNALGKLTNEQGNKYNTIVFAHCRNLASAPSESVSHYFSTEMEVAAQLKEDAAHTRAGAGAAPKGARGGAGGMADDGPSVNLVVLHRSDVEQPFQVRRFRFVPVPYQWDWDTTTTTAAPSPPARVPAPPRDAFPPPPHADLPGQRRPPPYVSTGSEDEPWWPADWG